MSKVYRVVTVTLTVEERKLLKEAIEKCEEIARNCVDEDMFVDASSVFCSVYESYKDEQIPIVVRIYE